MVPCLPILSIKWFMSSWTTLHFTFPPNSREYEISRSHSEDKYRPMILVLVEHSYQEDLVKELLHHCASASRYMATHGSRHVAEKRTSLDKRGKCLRKTFIGTCLFNWSQIHNITENILTRLQGPVYHVCVCVCGVPCVRVFVYQCTHDLNP